MNNSKILIFILVIVFVSYDTKANESFYQGTLAFCQKSHKSTPRLIGYCITSQTRAHSILKHYMIEKMKNYTKNVAIGRIFIKVCEQNQIVVNGKVWVNWVLVKYRFKIRLREYNEANGNFNNELIYL